MMTDEQLADIDVAVRGLVKEVRQLRPNGSN
jgi:hypothetical protein